MKPKDSLPCLQETTTGTYLEPHEFSLHPVTLIFNLMFSSLLWPGVPSGLFCSGFLTKILYACLAHYILLDLITLITFNEDYKLGRDLRCSWQWSFRLRSSGLWRRVVLSQYNTFQRSMLPPSAGNKLGSPSLCSFLHSPVISSFIWPNILFRNVEIQFGEKALSRM